MKSFCSSFFRISPYDTSGSSKATFSPRPPLPTLLSACPDLGPCRRKKTCQGGSFAYLANLGLSVPQSTPNSHEICPPSSSGLGLGLFFSPPALPPLFPREPVYLTCPLRPSASAFARPHAPRKLKCVPPLLSLRCGMQQATPVPCGTGAALPLSIHPPDSRVGTRCACAYASYGMRDRWRRRRPASARQSHPSS